MAAAPAPAGGARPLPRSTAGGCEWRGPRILVGRLAGHPGPFLRRGSGRIRPARIESEVQTTLLENDLMVPRNSLTGEERRAPCDPRAVRIPDQLAAAVLRALDHFRR